MTVLTTPAMLIAPKILNEIKGVLQTTRSQLNTPFYKRYEWEIRPTDLLEAFQRSRVFPKTYLKSRDNQTEVVGVGQALVGQSRLAINEAINLLGPNAKVFIGGRFDTEVVSSPQWDDFGSFCAFLPTFELSRRNEKWMAALNLIGSKTSDQIEQELNALESILETINLSDATSGPAVTYNQKSYQPNKSEWHQLTNQAIRHIKDEKFKKVVLARELKLSFDEPFDSGDLLRRLVQQPHKYIFSYAPSKTASFLGASPELLFNRRRNQIWTEAIAGTRHRDEDQKTDDALVNDLLTSPKDREEHFLVCEAIKSTLSGLCDSVTSSPHIEILKLPSLQHLIHRFQGVLKEKVSDWDILKILHPTPAVGGYPQQDTITFLRENESFDRGWYAAPFGFMSQSESLMVVAIRSVLLNGKEGYVYSGAGIVDSSDPQKEWEELNHKVRLMLELMQPLPSA